MPREVVEAHANATDAAAQESQGRVNPPQALASGLECLALIAGHFRINTTPDQIRASHLPLDANGLEPAKAVLAAATSMGFRARGARKNWDELVGLKKTFPMIARLETGNFVVVVGVHPTDDGDMLAVLDPLATPRNTIFTLSRERFEEAWSGELILLKWIYPLLDENQPFRLRWFVPELFRQRQLLKDVAVAALVLHVLALGLPIFTQLVIDKVVVHEGYSTLYVLTSGIVLVLVFEAIFSFLRQHFLLHATNRIDIRLAGKTFRHLLKLPITYFETQTAGVITRHIQQAETIRQFLTGRLMFTLLDASLLLFLLPLLFLYSGTLAFIVLGFALTIALVVFALVPTYKKRLQALYNAEAERQAMLVETIQGMRTVKSIAAETPRRQDWENRSARAVEMHFQVGRISITAQTAMGFLEKLMSVAVIGVGVHQIFDHTLTVGALIAFQMLAGRVVAPLVQIVSLIHEYQEAALSVRMLGNIMNHPVEGQRISGGLEPKLKGRIEFEGVSFRYGGADRPTLNQLGFTIPAGNFIGVVGRSGSGKTSLTRLIQGMYPIQEGVIRLDGIDIREIDLAHLRRNIGVVLQDSFLFRGTVRENIAINLPSATLEDVDAAARAAGAHEFIERLPQGYDTLLEENGANLSGGQKQRLSIARALLGNPRILILDEAASALDPESEAIFLRNLSRMVANRTVIMVSHRLSTLTRAHAIMVMDQGRIIDAAPHDTLLQRCELYRNLWHQQMPAGHGGNA